MEQEVRGFLWGQQQSGRSQVAKHSSTHTAQPGLSESPWFL